MENKVSRLRFNTDQGQFLWSPWGSGKTWGRWCTWTSTAAGRLKISRFGHPGQSWDRFAWRQARYYKAVILGTKNLKLCDVAWHLWIKICDFSPFELLEDTVGVFRELLLHVGLQDLVQGFRVLELAKEVVMSGLLVFRVLEEVEYRVKSLNTVPIFCLTPWNVRR